MVALTFSTMNYTSLPGTGSEDKVHACSGSCFRFNHYRNNNKSPAEVFHNKMKFIVLAFPLHCVLFSFTILSKLFTLFHTVILLCD